MAGLDLASVLLGSLPEESDRLAGQLATASIGGHQQDHVAEVGLASSVVGEGGVIHYLEEDVVDVGMGLLDLVQEEHGMRRAPDGISEQTTLVEAHIPGRSSDQP